MNKKLTLEKNIALISPFKMLLIFVSIYSAISVFFIFNSVGGEWINKIFEIPTFAENDPGGWYIPSALEMFEHQGRLIFPGHPGLPLHFGIFIVSKIYYILSLAWLQEIPFLKFCAYKIPHIIILSKLLMVFVNYINILLVYWVTKNLTRNEIAAFFAGIGFSLNSTILFYIGRVAPDIISITFFLISILLLWTIEDNLTKNNQDNQNYFYLSLLAMSSCMGLLNKIMLLFWLPFIVFGYLVYLLFFSENKNKLSRRTKYFSLLTFLSCFFITLGLLSFFMNWQDFIEQWKLVAENRGWVDKGNVLNYVKAAISQYSPYRAFSYFTMSNFFLVGGLGLFNILTKRHLYKFNKIAILIFPPLLGLPIWLPRKMAPHYLFIIITVAAVLVGFALRKFDFFTPNYKKNFYKFILFFVLILVIFNHGLIAISNSKVQDIIQYRTGNLDEIHSLMTSIDISQNTKIGIIDETNIFSPAMIHSLHQSYAPKDLKSKLIPEINQIFIQIPFNKNNMYGNNKRFSNYLKTNNIRSVVCIQNAEEFNKGNMVLTKTLKRAVICYQ